MKKSLFILAIMATSLAACNKNNLADRPAKHEEMIGNGLKYIEIAVSQEEPVNYETKAAFGTGANELKLSLGVGDQIAVLATKDETTAPVILTYTSYDDVNKKAVFGGTVDEEARIGDYAYYPASIATATEGTINWPTSVDGAKVQVPMMARLDGASKFKHLGAIAKIAVTNCPDGATKLKFTASSNITGPYTVSDLSTDTPSVTAGSLTGKTITATISGNGTYYIPLPVNSSTGTTFSDFQFALINSADTYYYKQRTATVSVGPVARKNIVNFGTLNYDVDQIEEWYMICANQSSAWTVSDKSIRMIKIGDNQYRNATNNGRWQSDEDDTRGYKIADATASGWSDVYGNSTAYQLSGTLTKGADKNCFWGDDGYKIYAGTINTSSYTYSNEWKAESNSYNYSDMKMVGDFNSWSKDSGGYSFTKTAAHNWKMTSSLTVSSNQKVEFKLITASQWDYGNWGGVSITDDTPYGTCTTRGSGSDPDTARSSYILTQGQYDVYFNDVTRDIMFVKVANTSSGLEDMTLSSEYNI